MTVLMIKRDIIVTWPKQRPLESYLHELREADKYNQDINYRVACLPKWPDAIEDHGWIGWSYGVEHPRCYMVHDGYIRGWCKLRGATWKTNGRVLDPSTGGFMKAGWYIVRDPEWHAIKPVPMQGFQGWRWLRCPTEKHDAQTI
jgi:hypothetical protein